MGFLRPETRSYFHRDRKNVQVRIPRESGGRTSRVIKMVPPRPELSVVVCFTTELNLTSRPLDTGRHLLFSEVERIGLRRQSPLLRGPLLYR